MIISSEEREVSNLTLAKLFSWEFILSAVLFVFALGVAWNNVNTKVMAADEKLHDQDRRLQNTEQAIQRIEIDTAVIKQNQISFKQSIELQAMELKQQGKDTAAILRILEKNNAMRREGD